MTGAFCFFSAMKNNIPTHVLPVIVLAQFAGTSLWFAGNAVINDLIIELSLPDIFLGYITTSVQAGFIAGTLLFAVLSIADRFSPVKVFLICAVLGSAANLTLIPAGSGLTVIFARFITGFFLAGIYPVGMKIASDWHKEGLGKALGYLVGALVVGTAFPHLLKYMGGEWPWRYVIAGTSILSSAGGLLLFLAVPNGPHRAPTAGFTFDVNAILKLFGKRNFRSAAFGYFGHMWELYTFWAFVPVMITTYLRMGNYESFPVSLWSFIVIGIGGLSCIVGGYLSLTKGSKHVSIASLIGSGVCCLLLPVAFTLPLAPFLIWLLFWGVFVIPDSPQFSTLVARSSDTSLVATGLTIVNCIGFALTIVSIQLMSYLWIQFETPLVFLIMIFGPAAGLASIRYYQSEV